MLKQKLALQKKFRVFLIYILYYLCHGANNKYIVYLLVIGFFILYIYKNRILLIEYYYLEVRD